VKRYRHEKVPVEGGGVTWVRSERATSKRTRDTAVQYSSYKHHVRSSGDGSSCARSSGGGRTEVTTRTDRPKEAIAAVKVTANQL
jgi:hypothetical protein